jgi:PAS domain S-box-containing protein
MLRDLEKCALACRTLGRLALTDMFRFLEPFEYPEPQPIVAARARVASRLSLLTLCLGLGLFVSDRLTGVPMDPDSLLTLGLAGMGLGAWVLLKLRHYRVVAWLLVASLFGMAAASTHFYGSARTVNNALLLVGLVAVALFLSRRAMIGSTAAAIALLAGMTWADAAGWLAGQPDFLVGWRTWVSQAACLVGVAAMMYLNRTQMKMAQALHLQAAQERLKAMDERDLGQERFLRFFRSSPAALFVQSTRDGHIIDVNPAFERMTGYRRRQVTGKRDGFLWARDALHDAFIQARRQSRRTDWCPVTLLCHNGQPLAVQVCSERDDDPQDGLAITALRVPGHERGGLATAFAGLEVAQHA